MIQEPAHSLDTILRFATTARHCIQIPDLIRRKAFLEAVPTSPASLATCSSAGIGVFADPPETVDHRAWMVPRMFCVDPKGIIERAALEFAFHDDSSAKSAARLSRNEWSPWRCMTHSNGTENICCPKICSLTSLTRQSASLLLVYRRSLAQRHFQATGVVGVVVQRHVGGAGVFGGFVRDYAAAVVVLLELDRVRRAEN